MFKTFKGRIETQVESELIQKGDVFDFNPSHPPSVEYVVRKGFSNEIFSFSKEDIIFNARQNNLFRNFIHLNPFGGSVFTDGAKYKLIRIHSKADIVYYIEVGDQKPKLILDWWNKQLIEWVHGRKINWNAWQGVGAIAAVVIMILVFFVPTLTKDVKSDIETTKQNDKTTLKDSIVFNPTAVKGIVTLDDLNWRSNDSLSLIDHYCKLLENERLSLKQTSFVNEEQYINWIVEKYFGNNLSSKDYTIISQPEGKDLMLKIETTDSLDFPKKEIQVGLSSVLKGKIDNNDNIDYVIPFYTNGGGNYYYCQLLFVVNDTDSIRIFRNCKIEQNNFKFELISLNNRVVNIKTFNRSESDPWCCPSIIDTIKLRYFNGKMVFTN